MPFTRFLKAIALASVFALPAHAATLPVRPETLASALHAKPTDTLQLAPGNYGDVVIKYAPVHIIGPRTAVLHSLSIQPGGSYSTFSGPTVYRKPDATTKSFTPAVKLAGTPTSRVKGVTLSNLAVTCGLAVVGIMPDLDPALQTTKDAWKAAGGNVLGYAVGDGITVSFASNITIDHNEVSGCAKGIGPSNSDHVTVSNNHVHDFRSSPFDAASVSYLTLTGNYFHDAHPWRPETGQGDHGDLVHIWTEAGKPAVDHLTISRNLFDQGAGWPLLGIYLDDNNHGIGFTNVAITDNTIILANNQAMRLENVGGFVTGNTLLQPPGPGKAPHIIVCDPRPTVCFASSVAVSGNITPPGVQAAAALATARAKVWPTTAGLAPLR